MEIQNKVGKFWLSILVILGGYITSYAYAPYEYSWAFYLGTFIYCLTFAINFVKRDKITLNPDTKKSIFFPWLWDFSFTFSTLFWLIESIEVYGSFPWYLSYSLMATITLVISIRSIFVALIFKLFDNYLLFIPLIYSVVSYVYNQSILNFDWLNFGYTAIDKYSIALAPIGGVWLIQFVKLSISVLLFCLVWYITKTFASAGFREFNNSRLLSFKQARFTNIAVLSIVAIITQIISFFPQQYTKTDGVEHKVALIQPNIKPGENWDPALLNQQIHLYQNLLNGLVEDAHKNPEHKVELVVLPESAIGSLWGDYIQSIYQGYAWTVGQMGAGLLTGTFYNHHNSIMLISNLKDAYMNHQADDTSNEIRLPTPPTGPYITMPNNLIGQLAYKRHLVPFGEYLPMAWLLKDLHPFFTTLDSFAIQKGNYYQENFAFKGSSIVTQICYDVLFSHELAANINKDTTVGVAISNDIWFGNTAGPYQHFNIVRLRALENQRYMIRDANNGITAVVNNYGEVVDQVPRNTTTTLISSWYNYTGTTPYQSYWWLNLVFATGFIALTSIIWLLKKRNH